MPWIGPSLDRFGGLRSKRLWTPAAPVEPPLNVFNAVSEGGCHNDGVHDDVGLLGSAASVAKAYGLALYLPAGLGYYCATPWVLPTGLTVVGDGLESHIMGETRMNTDCSLSDLFLGVSTGKALGFATTSLITGVSFNRCRFRGGTNASVFSQTSAYQHFNGITFTDCTFEVAYFTSFTALAHSVALQTDKYNQLMDNLTFDHCRFGAPNEYGQTENKYGNILFYTHGEESMDASQYCDNLTVKNCIFEKSWNWAVDYAMNQGTTRVYPLEYCGFTCEDNLFKGCGGHRAETPEDFPIALDLEPVYNASVRRNVLLRCSYESLKFTYGCRYSVAEDNIFDYRIDNGIYDQVGAGTSTDRWIYRILWIADGDHNSALNNTLYLPSSYSSKNTSNWVIDDGDYSTVSGNSVIFNDSQVDWEATMDVGPRAEPGER